MTRLATLAPLLVLLATTAQATPGPTPKEAIDFLAKRIGASQLSLNGKTPEMLFDCGVKFAATTDRLVAYFYHPQGRAEDVRSYFEIKPETKVVSFDEKAGRVVVDNVYLAREGGREKKTNYRARMDIDLDARGAVRSINLGWNRDRQAPLMFRCDF